MIRKDNAMKARSKARARPETQTTEAAPKLVYTNAPVLLGRVMERTRAGYIVDLGAVKREMVADPSVDPALIEEAMQRGARVLVDQSGEPCIVGVIATQRSVVIDSEGRVDAKVRSFSVDAREEVLLKVPGAFMRAVGREVEVYGDRVLTRARDLAKIMSAMIKLN
jgi:hypothetical protein